MLHLKQVVGQIKMSHTDISLKSLLIPNYDHYMYQIC